MVRVAVFGCLHGKLNEMYREVERLESNSPPIDFIIVCGDCQTIRHPDDLKCLNVPHKFRTIGDFHDYYSGKYTIPKLTIFVGGNHEASNYLMTLPYGGWVCDNIYYLGYAGVIRYKGLRIAGVSGIYNSRNCNRGRFEQMPLTDESIRSIYHTRRLDIFRLQLLSEKAQQEDMIDVFISHDWPAKIYEHGDKERLMRKKQHFIKDIKSPEGLGSPMTQPLVHQLKPKRWFAAHLHCKFSATVTHDRSKQRYTRFLSLDKIGSGRMGDGHCEALDLELDINKQEEPIDDGLYYDPEWLAILKKTLELEKDSTNNVFCPRIDDQKAEQYLPTKKEIEETKRLMDETGGLKIQRNFRMVEPVIYGRSNGERPSLDRERVKFYPNFQTEELCSRLGFDKPQGKLTNPNKSVELDEDGCLPFYIDTKGDC